MGPKAKVSLTLDREILEALDRETASGRKANRSEMVESVLRAWIRMRKKQKLDRAIADYYRSLSAADAKEEARWAELADDTVTHLWDET